MKSENCKRKKRAPKQWYEFVLLCLSHVEKVLRFVITAKRFSHPTPYVRRCIIESYDIFILR